MHRPSLSPLLLFVTHIASPFLPPPPSTFIRLNLTSINQEYGVNNTAGWNLSIS